MDTKTLLDKIQKEKSKNYHQNEMDFQNNTFGFDVMRMDNAYPTAKELLQQYKSHGNILAEPKFEGIRTLIICDIDKNEVLILSRHGKERKNFPTLNKQFENLLTQLDQSIVFDGEIMSDKFNTMMKQVYREPDANTDDATIFLYDIIPLKNFIKGYWNQSIYARKQILEQFNYGSNIEIMEYKRMNIIDNPNKLIEYSNQNFNKGHEGTIVKDMNSIYTCDKSSAWLKIKSNFKVDISLPITDVEDDGTLIVKGKDVDYGFDFTETKIESNFSNVEKNKLIGQVIVVRADNLPWEILSPNVSHDNIKLRNPKFIEFRGFMSLDDNIIFGL